MRKTTKIYAAIAVCGSLAGIGSFVLDLGQDGSPPQANNGPTQNAWSIFGDNHQTMDAQTDAKGGIGEGKGSYEVDFSDSKWGDSFDGLEQFNFSKDGLPGLYPKLESPFPEGGALFHKTRVSGNVELFLSGRPLQKKTNLTVELGRAARCIIGDGDSQYIKCERNTAFPDTPEVWQAIAPLGSPHEARSFYGQGWESSADITVKVIGESAPKSRKMKFRLVVMAFRPGSDVQAPVEFDYEIVLPAVFEEYGMQYGFGLIDPMREGIGFVPRAFNLHERF